jgi:hypothetical protein
MMMLRAVGMFLIAMGIIWALQGTGALEWPANSFMLGRAEWALYGAMSAGLGAIILWWATRRKRG